MQYRYAVFLLLTTALGYQMYVNHSQQRQLDRMAGAQAVPAAAQLPLRQIPEFMIGGKVLYLPVATLTARTGNILELTPVPLPGEPPMPLLKVRLANDVPVLKSDNQPLPGAEINSQIKARNALVNELLQNAEANQDRLERLLNVLPVQTHVMAPESLKKGDRLSVEATTADADGVYPALRVVLLRLTSE